MNLKFIKFLFFDNPESVGNGFLRKPSVDYYFYQKTVLTSNNVQYCWLLVDSASNRNEYQEYFLGGKGGRCVGLTMLPPSGADCLDIWEPQPSGTLTACPGL
jgi:hypothetical protein